MTLPPGFKAKLFAGEPDIVQPIAAAFDDRGRLWVAECLSYPQWITDPAQAGHDRIVILEDQSPDGHFTKKTVFADNIVNLSGIELGFGGVWLCSAPNLLFIPIDATGDKPAGPPQVVLDGWDIQKAGHNIFNRLTWGPDGWLYGCNGIQSESMVGKPGTPEDERIPLNCGVWRYHPTRQIFERFAQGTTNPWGLDFDDYGQMFITNCVIEHIFHVVPGGNYKRMRNQSFDPYAYDFMVTCADHIHWAGGAWQSSRGGLGAHNATGGGHAHAGCMVYLGDNWPDEYRNNAFMCNIHGNRINRDILSQKASGYVASHAPDFLLANDSWFRGLQITYGPDGGVFVNDWTDTGECHNHVAIDRSNGRIYKVTYGDVTPRKVDLQSLPDAELVKLQLHKNDWFVRHARRILQERAAAKKLGDDVIPALQKMYTDQTDPTRKLRALWALFAVGGRDLTKIALGSVEPCVRGWGVRLMVDAEPFADDTTDALTEAAASDSPVVRMAVLSALQRLKPMDRGGPLNELIWRSDDAADWNYVQMLWYACGPLAFKTSASDFDGRVATCGIPLIREYAARTLADRKPEDAVEALLLLVTNLDDGANTAKRRACVVDELRGLRAAMKTRRLDTPPADWPRVTTELAKIQTPEERRLALLISLSFNDPAAQQSARAFVKDANESADDRREMLTAIVQSKPAGLAALLRDLLTDKSVGDVAIRSLAATNDPATPAELITRYAGFSPDSRRDAVATLASRPTWAMELLRAVEDNKIPHGDVGALTVRQLLNLKDKAVAAEVAKLWGKVRKADEDKLALMTQYRAELAPAALAKANLSNGRAVFDKTCAACHTMFDAGGKVGPDLTGSQRANLDYVLENVLDPSAIVAKEYLMTVVTTNDGQTITGIVAEESAASVSLKMPGQTQTIQKSDIKSRKTESISMMPEGLFQALTADERRDLVAYLASPNQVAPSTK